MAIDGEIKLSASNRGAVDGIQEIEKALDRAARTAQDAGRKADQSGAGWEGLSRKLLGTGGPASGLSNTLGILGPVAKMAAVGITAVTLAAGAASAAAVKGVGDWATYQDQVANVATMLDRKALGDAKYNKFVEEYSEGIRELSVDMNQHTEVLAKGAYDILSASVDASQGLEVLAASGKAAVGGNTNVATSADLVTGAMNAWRSSFTDATEVTDIAFATVKEGKLTYDELAQSLGTVAPSANMVGMQFSQLGAILGLLTQNNIKANEAASATNQFLLSFVRQSPTAIKTWHELSQGTELANTAWNASLVRGANLSKTLAVLSKATDAQKVALFSEVNALKVGNILISQQDSYRAKLQTTTHAAGETEEAFSKKTNTLGQQLGRLDKIASDVSKTIGQGFAPEVKSITDQVVSWYQANGQLVKTDILIWIEKLKRGLRGVKDFFTLGSDGTGATLDENIADKQSEIAELEEKLRLAQGKAQVGAKDTGFEFLNTLNKNAAKSAAKDVSSLTVELSLLQRQLNILETQKNPLSAEEVKARKQMYKDLADPLRLDPKYQELYAALDKANYTPDPASNTQATGLTDAEKKIAAENEAVAKATKERMAQMGALVDMENELRAQSLSGLDQSLFKMEKRYDGYYEKLDDWALYNCDNVEEYEARKAKITEAKAAERAKIVAGYQEKQRQEEAKTSKVQSEYAMAMAEATGDSLALQELQHQRFVENWVARGVSLAQAEELWQAQHVADTKSMLEKTLDAWTDTDKLIEQGTKQSVEAVYNSWEGFLNDITENGFDDLGDSALEAFHAIGDAWAQMAVQMFAQWTMSGMAGLLKDVLGFLGGSGGSFDFSNLLGNLFGKSSSTGGGIASTALGGATGAGLWAGAKALGTQALSALGIEFGTQAATQAGIQAAVQSASEMAAAYGASAAGEFAMTTAAEQAVAQFGGTLAGGEFAGTGALYGGASEFGYGAAMGGEFAGATGTNAATNAASLAGLSATLTPMGLALGVGSLGAMLSSMGFLMDGPMTPEEAKDRWEGEAKFLEATAALEKYGATMQGVGEGFGPFSDSTEQAWQAFEKLREVAKFTEEQLAAVKASLSPMARHLLDTGEATDTLKDSVGGLVQEMNAAINSYTMTGEATRGYQDRIDALAAKLGLTGQEARKFSDEIWDLADSFSQGGEEASQFDRKLSDFVGTTLGELADQADEGTDSVRNLIDAMNQVGSVKTSTTTNNSGDNEHSTDDKPKTVGLYHTGGRIAPLTRFHQGGPLLDDLPRFHSGYQLGGLGHDEVPIIGKVGEFMVRSERVTASTLPALQAFNLGAQAPAYSGPAVVVNGPLVQIEGSYTGSEAQFEDLARRLESKLRELDRSRWKA